MASTLVNGSIFKIHPIYNLYGSDENGNIINIIQKDISNGSKSKDGYMICAVKSYRDKQRLCYVHRFVYECYNGPISQKK